MNFGSPEHPDHYTPRMSFGIGHVISGKYRVEHVLGEGGMGLVVAARHLELEELYAIKIMKREAVGNDAHAERRFIAEARAAARLKGVHVAHVHDIGRLHTGELYMVMEYLRGVDLKRLVRMHGPLPVDIAVTYLLQACEAIWNESRFSSMTRPSGIRPSSSALATHRSTAYTASSTRASSMHCASGPRGR